MPRRFGARQPGHLARDRWLPRDDRDLGEAFTSERSEIVSTEMPDDHHLIAEIRQRAVGVGSGVPVEMTIFYLLEVRDRRAVRFHIYGDREAALAATR